MSGKDGGFPLPTIIDPPRVCVTLNIPNERAHIAAFWGALWLLTYWNQWRRDELKTGAAVGLVWKDVIREAWATNEGYEGCEGGSMFDVRQNEENPCVLEKSESGGAWAAWANIQLCKPALKIVGGVPVWTNPTTGIDEPFDGVPPDAPVYPPRAPRPEGTPNSARCNAAAAAAQIVAQTAREAATQFNAGGELSLMLLFIGLIFLPLGIAITIGLALAAIANDLLSLVLSVPPADVDAALEEELTCVIYCATEISAGVMSVDFELVVNQLNALSAGADKYALVRAVIETIGEAGLLAALDVRGVVGDCVDCADCPEETGAWCYDWVGADLQNDWFSWESSPTVGAQWDASAQGWKAKLDAPATDFNARAMYLRKEFPNMVDITQIQIEIDRPNDANMSVLRNAADTSNLGGSPSFVGNVWTINTSRIANQVSFAMWRTNNSLPLQIRVVRIRVRGVGVKPFGLVSNCE